VFLSFFLKKKFIMASNTVTNDNQDPSNVPYCKCRDENDLAIFALEKVSKTEKNMDRSFYGCSKPSSKGGCNYFCWVSDVIVDPKTGLAKRKYIPPSEESLKKRNKHEETAVQALMELNQSLEQRVKAQEDMLANFDSRLQKLEEKKEEPSCSPEDGILTQPKSQKKTGTPSTYKRGFTRPKLLD